MLLGMAIIVITLLQAGLIQISRGYVVQNNLVYADEDTMGIVTGTQANEVNSLKSDAVESNNYENSLYHKALQIIRVATVAIFTTSISLLGYKIKREADKLQEFDARSEGETIEDDKSNSEIAN